MANGKTSQLSPYNFLDEYIQINYLDLENNTGTVDSPTDVNRIFTSTRGGTIQKPWMITASNELLDLFPSDITAEPTGFPNRTDSELSFTSATRTFQISDTAGGSFDYYYKGELITVSSDPTVVISDTNGIHYIYFNSSGTLVSSTSFWDLETTIPVATVLWNTDLDSGTGLGLIAEERHGLSMDWATHSLLHSSIGTQYGTGLAMSGYTLDTDSDAAVQFGISGGTIRDEDIDLVITHSAAPSNPLEQILNDPAEIPVFYKSGASGDWAWDAATTFAFKNTAAGRVNWNQWTGATWQQTEATDNYFVAYWIVATGIHDSPVIAIQGQRQDQLLTNAKDNNSIGSVDFGDLPFQEVRILYRVILRTKTTFGGTRKAKISEVLDMRVAGNTIGGSYIPVTHGDLAGLGDDDHAQYALLAGRSGGQILYGSTIASEDLTLDSTSNATKGFININSPFAFDTSMSAPAAHSEGQVYWDTDDHTLAIQTDVSGVVLQVGQENLIRVTNTSGVTINNGEAVYVTGAQGSRPTVAKAKADSSTTCEVFGVATEDIVHQANGYVTVLGKVRGLDMSAFSDGDHLYLSAATAGALTDTAPAFPNYVIKVGCVLNNAGGTAGELFVGLDPEQSNTTSFNTLRVHNSLEIDAAVGTDLASGLTSFGTTTPAVTYSQALHVHTDGTYVLADADDSDLVPCTALAIDTGAGSGKEVLLQGYINNSSWTWTVGGMIYLSTTAGGLTQTAPSAAGEIVQIVGYAVDTDIMYFNPQLGWVTVT